jgi:hypothetical protein
MDMAALAAIPGLDMTAMGGFSTEWPMQMDMDMSGMTMNKHGQLVPKEPERKIGTKGVGKGPKG